MTHRQVLVMQKVQRTVDVPLVQYIEATVDVQLTLRTNHQDVTENGGGSSESVFSSGGTRARRDSTGAGSAALCSLNTSLPGEG